MTEQQEGQRWTIPFCIRCNAPYEQVEDGEEVVCPCISRHGNRTVEGREVQLADPNLVRLTEEETRRLLYGLASDSPLREKFRAHLAQLQEEAS